MSVVIGLVGGPAHGQTVALAHAMDSTVYVPTGERGSWFRYQRRGHELAAAFQGVYTRPAPAEPKTTRKRGRS